MNMICLGIESTAHTFSVGITDGKKELANEKEMYKAKGGIHPREASQFMARKAPEVISRALKKSGKTISDINVIAFAQGPGLGPCLRIGAGIAKYLAYYYDLPLVGVNHCVAHIEVGKWQHKIKDPLIIYVSGANTQVLGASAGKYRIYGETLDVGLGNAIDMFAREFGIPLPGGPWIESQAKKGRKYIPLPYSVKGMDMIFSGLVTAAKKKDKSNDLIYSFQETIFSMLIEVSERALAHTKKKELLLVGGVAQNKRLCEMCEKMASEHQAKFFVPKPEYNGDNGFMIALTGLKMHEKKVKQKDFGINQKWRTDEVQVI